MAAITYIALTMSQALFCVLHLSTHFIHSFNPFKGRSTDFNTWYIHVYRHSHSQHHRGSIMSYCTEVPKHSDFLLY